VAAGADSERRNCCWVCDSWQEVEFAYQLSAKDMKKFKAVLAAGERAVPAHKLAREKEKISRAL
jgi:predicted transcriptional regulator